MRIIYKFINKLSRMESLTKRKPDKINGKRQPNTLPISAELVKEINVCALISLFLGGIAGS
jgi:hypothetical protein